MPIDPVDWTARRALDRYDVGELHIGRRYAGECNVVYRVADDTANTYALRVSTFRYLRGTDVARDRAEIRTELRWLQALRRDTGIQAPLPVPARDASLVQGIHDPTTGRERLCVLLSWVDGDEVMAPQVDHMRRIGAVIARLHDHALQFAQVEPVHRGVHDWSELHPDIDRGLETAAWVSDEDAEAIRAATRKLASVVAAMPRDGQFGLIHADVRHANVRFIGSDVGVFDFDEAVLGFHTADLAKPLMRTQPGREYDVLQGALFSGYQSVRALPEDCSRHVQSIRFAYKQLIPMAWALHEPDWGTREEHRRILEGQARGCREYLDAQV